MNMKPIIRLKMRDKFMGKKFVTLEMFEEYDRLLKEYIGMHDDLILNGETTCPKCGATITSDKCNKCAKENEVEV